MTKEERLNREIKRTEKAMAFDKEYMDEYEYVCGIDEVGRGPLAGPVMAAAVILPKNCDILYINDSKKLSPKKREEMAKKIEEIAISIGYGVIDEKIIDEINILNATKRAMKIAIENLSVKPDFCLIDSVKLDNVSISQKSFTKGDEKSMSIAAASIVAKVKRDKYMVEISKKYPEYHFEKNKGYGTKEHIYMLKKYGYSDIHRKTFLKFLSE